MHMAARLKYANSLKLLCQALLKKEGEMDAAKLYEYIHTDADATEMSVLSEAQKSAECIAALVSVFDKLRHSEVYKQKLYEEKNKVGIEASLNLLVRAARATKCMLAIECLPLASADGFPLASLLTRALAPVPCALRSRRRRSSKRRYPRWRPWSRRRRRG